MPGESVSEALNTASEFKAYSISNIFTYLGENITDLSEAGQVTDHYLNVLEKIEESGLPVSISLKLTQIGFDLSKDQTYHNFKSILSLAGKTGNFVWIDMEDSSYTDRTIDFYKAIKTDFPNTGICLQAYLYRTESDIQNLQEISPNIRLVKGAYLESSDVAFPKRKDVDENYLKLAKLLLDGYKAGQITPSFATHDERLLTQIADYISRSEINSCNFNINMLYGIKPGLQRKLAAAGFDVAVLISYGDAWFPWYMRRLAERPANLGFVLKNMFRR
jgi:proline dehydrogenase